MARTDRYTAWHPLLGIALSEASSSQHWQTLTELQRSKEPLRVDEVVIRRLETPGEPPPVQVLVSLLSDLGAHTLVHFRGPTDELDGDDALMLLAYASQYLVVAAVPHAQDLVLRVLAPTLWPRFVTRPQELGCSLVQLRPGVHQGRLGAFPLRVLEDSVASEAEGDRLLYAFSPAMLQRPGAGVLRSELELRIFRRIVRAIEQLRDSKERLAMKDFELADKVLHGEWDAYVDMFSVGARLRGLTPEQRLAGLTPAEHLSLLPLEALRALSEEYVSSLPAEVQDLVRARRGH